MPSPVFAARQCLTPDAAAAFDDAVSIATRRGHSQTTSLHMLSSLLALPASFLREACVRTRHTAYSAGLQFKALDLTLAVSLDRLPSSQSDNIEEPPVSNSLMAAIKRSQANQRRQPGCLTFNHPNHHHHQQYSSLPVVKVELQNLTFSILDDPLVSRVFGEAGFRSYNIKMAAIRPRNIFNPSLFSINFNYYDKRSERGDTVCKFPFISSFSKDENATRIGGVMVRTKKKNPLLLGVSASDALKAFLQTLQGKTDGVLPLGLSGVSLLCIEDEISRFMNGNSDVDDVSLELRFQEVERILGNDRGQGVLVNLGDFNALCGDGVTIDGLKYLGRKLSSLVMDHGRKLWLIGSAYSYEVYFKVLNKFPSIEEDWDLGILAITSFTFSKGASIPRSSLMESFVPLGGFFSLPFDATGSLSNICQYTSQSLPCDDKGSAEVTSLSCRGPSSSDADGNQSSLPSLSLPNTEMEFVAPKANVNDILLENAKSALLRKNWGSAYEQNNYHQPYLKDHPSSHLMDGKGTTREKSRGCSNALSVEAANKDLISIAAADMQQIRNLDASSTSTGDDHTSPISASSVTTDLCLGIIPSFMTTDVEKPANQSQGDSAQDLLAFSSNTFSVDALRTSTSNCSSRSSSSCCFCDNYMHYNLKELNADLVDRFGHQESAINDVIEAITQWQSSCRGIWINLRGPDKLSKKKLGLALAEVLYGSKECLIYADLSFQDEANRSDPTLNPQVVNRYHLSMRGTVVDYLVEKLSKHPSVVFLENIDKSDLVVQNSLLKAVKTGRLTDLHGREVNIRHSMFLSTTRFLVGTDSLSSSEELHECSEETILNAKPQSIQICIGFDLNNKRKTDEHGISRETKRAHKVASNICLDLNLPAKGSKTCSNSEKLRLWLEDFEKQIDGIVVFKPFEFGRVEEELLKEISECLHKIVGWKCTLEVERRVMQQVIAAVYVSGAKRVGDWIEDVVRKGFEEAMGKFGLRGDSIVKLVSCDRTQIAEGVLLPERILIA